MKYATIWPILIGVIIGLADEEDIGIIKDNSAITFVFAPVLAAAKVAQLIADK